jgi:hypothetical protein
MQGIAERTSTKTIVQSSRIRMAMWLVGLVFAEKEDNKVLVMLKKKFAEI